MKNRGWIFLLPSLLLVALSAIIPIMTVVNYSLHNLVPGSIAEFYGLGNFIEVLQDEFFMDAISRQFMFTLQVLLIEIPLGLFIATLLPSKKGPGLTTCFILLGVPLLIPWNVVGIVWRVFTRSDLGIATAILNKLGYNYLVTEKAIDAWLTVLIMDIWHWVPLVVLLCYAGLQTIPAPYYQAARIDGASKWSTFFYVTLPRLRYVLIIAVLLRAIDSFNIYAEPYMITGGGPGNSTNFMNIYTSSQTIDAFDMGYGAAMSLIYLLIVVLMCYVLYTIMLQIGQGGDKK
jgi:glycerol transport system permease protein